MFSLRNICLVIGASTVALSADAIIAKRDIRTVVQPDGTEVQVRVVGDEFMHFTTSLDGEILSIGDDGYVSLGQLTPDGAVVSSGTKFTQSGVAQNALKLKDIDFSSISAARKKATGMRRAPQSGVGRVSTSFSANGSPKALIILVQYSDVAFTLSDPKAYFEDMINGAYFTQYGGTGSALKYFQDQSSGKFSPEFDILGPVTLPNARKYYGGNDRYDEDSRPHMMVYDAIKILDPTVDFSQYDTDGDGLIDNVYLFYAGQGEASYGPKESVWPHSWDFRYSGITLTVDGVTVANYACSNEWEYNRPDGIGTFVHEFSHVMGLPDLYHTQAIAYYTPCEYSVLDYGPYNNDGRTPPNYSAYERNALGWNEPIMLTEPLTVTLNPITSGEFGLIPTKKNSEFFLLENRQLEGWDKYIPWHGMLIWHIDYVASVFNGNVVNNTKSHQYVDIVEANNTPDGSSVATMQGWPFPGTSNKTSFTSTTTPALKDWSGNAVNYPVTDIVEENGLITFNILGGGSSLDTPVAIEPEKGSDYFVAKWTPVEGASDYILTVYAADEGASGSITVGFDGSKLPDGWSASYQDWYTTTGNYGNSSPSYKFKNNGQTLTSPVLPGSLKKIEFWNKGQGTNSSTSLNIEGFADGQWVQFASCTPQNNKVLNPVIEDIPGGVTQVRFILNKNLGNIAVDDIVLTYGGNVFALDDYNGISTGGATAYRVDRLKDGIKNYHYTVQAVDGTNKSRVSEPYYVILDGLNAVEDILIENDDTVEYYNLQGVRIDNPAPGSIVIRRQGKNVSKTIIR